MYRVHIQHGTSVLYIIIKYRFVCPICVWVLCSPYREPKPLRTFLGKLCTQRFNGFYPLKPFRTFRIFFLIYIHIY